MQNTQSLVSPRATVSLLLQVSLWNISLLKGMRTRQKGQQNAELTLSPHLYVKPLITATITTYVSPLRLYILLRNNSFVSLMLTKEPRNCTKFQGNWPETPKKTFVLPLTPKVTAHGVMEHNAVFVQWIFTSKKFTVKQSRLRDEL